MPTSAEDKREAARLHVVTGQRYLRMDRPEQAEAEFRIALQFDPELEDAKRALEALRRDYESALPAPAPLPER
jgi:Tfp pilus assembly protein PilF